MVEVQTTQNAAPDTQRPLLVYDGDCGFCRKWIARWKAMTGERVAYAPYQQVADRFPHVPIEHFRAAVQLIEPGGEVYSGAEAVFRSLATMPRKRWMLWAYRRVPLFGAVSRAAYRFVANHRRGLSAVTRSLWGRHLEPSTFHHSRRLFVRAMGMIYFIAFASLGVQIVGLVGSDGITPLADSLDRIHARLGNEAYWSLPTLCWLNAGDAFLRFLCWGGAAMAALLVIGAAPIPLLIGLWAFYLSLTNAGGVFLRFQWDILLLETGFLAIFVAPLSWRLGSPRAAPPSRVAMWLVKWLLFRLMFLSGLVKLAVKDPTWEGLTALNYHYLTQPLPTWTAWYAHQLPEWFQKTCVVLMFAAELGVPFLLFAPRRIRHAACAVIVGFMALIGGTGNYNFFNLLTCALCVPLLDDAVLRGFVPGRLRRWIVEPRPRVRRRWVRSLAVLLLAVYIVPASMVEAYMGTWHKRIEVGWVNEVLGFTDPFRLTNSYGLFRVMTTSRHEIVVEGSNDGKTWLEYELKWKPGDVTRAPAFCEPHQPRLDWQMWFAALSTYERTPWFGWFMRRLLEGSPRVLALLERNPFPEAPPKLVRAVLYDYRFTDPATRRESGAWWKRERLGLYARPMSLGHR